MTSKEVVKQGNYHGQDYYDLDGSGNLYEGHVYEVDGVLYLVEYCNRRICEPSEPIKMKATEVTTYEYEPI